MDVAAGAPAPTAPPLPPPSPIPAAAATPRCIDTAAIVDEDLFLGDDKDQSPGRDDDNDLDDDNDNDEDDDDYDDDDIDDGYFSTTYRPLSNLPTPPPSSCTSSMAQSPWVHHGEILEASLLGPAVHLVNLLPPAASLATPSVPLVQAMLTRAQLPLATVALAVCILDSLDSRFARTWRQTCPLGIAFGTTPSSSAVPACTAHPPLSPLPSTVMAAQSSTSAAAGRARAPPQLPPVEDRLRHIDAVFPEVIVLAALVIAVKFSEDGPVGQQPARAYCAAWATALLGESPAQAPAGKTVWTAAQLAVTERCIMQNLDYRILPLVDADLLADAEIDMRRAGVQALRMAVADMKKQQQR